MFDIFVAVGGFISLGIFALHAVEAYQTHKRVTP